MPETAELQPAAAAPPAERAGFRLAVFAAVLVVALATGFGAGRLTGAPAAAPSAPAQPAPAAEPAGDGHDHGGGTGTAAAPGAPPAGAAAEVGGLSLSAAGLRLVPAAGALAAGRPQQLSFRIEDSAGAPVTRFAVVHDKQLHLIVARRDLTGFQHLHPQMAADGTWSTPLTLPAAGPWRMFADFTAVGADGTNTAVTLGADLTVPGDYRPEPLPAPATTAQAGPYAVHYEGAPRTGAAQPLLFHVAGAQLEPYLGAFGHLVVLREGDLGYVHVHPEEQLVDGALKFWLTAPSRGAYRMFLDVQVGGTVHTAAFSLTVS
ncbi:hypothetical protein [Spirilliplanes yamanashiensis]|uniref:Secreted protein n=1 Tax=Spirilliplanes yamanashiensis TaxID=42233 RepID=A0A8J3Y9V2_9ACTN|nr:hypothetical protein [Spirilliplanes yamanashiensis]MDP9815773.1 hypothetical protein [Spirilliplanes yamanashiensis]GIJ04027.1 hypothetical protein Sya03_33790 [Spirilliplanes yamanashiensis]